MIYVQEYDGLQYFLSGGKFIVVGRKTNEEYLNSIIHVVAETGRFRICISGYSAFKHYLCFTYDLSIRTVH